MDDQDSGKGPDGATWPASDHVDHLSSGAEQTRPRRRFSIVSARPDYEKRLSPDTAEREWVSAYNLDPEKLKKWLDDQFNGKFALSDHGINMEERGDGRTAITEDRYRILVPRRLTDEEKELIEGLRDGTREGKEKWEQYSEDEESENEEMSSIGAARDTGNSGDEVTPQSLSDNSTQLQHDTFPGSDEKAIGG